MLANLSIRLSSVVDNINKVEEFLSNIMTSFGIDVFYQAKVAIAVEEAVMNAISYGNSFDSNKFFTIEFNYNNEYFDFVISDEGQGFDCKDISNPILSDYEDEVRGLFLIKTLSDELIFNNNGSKLTMRFYNNIRSIA